MNVYDALKAHHNSLKISHHQMLSFKGIYQAHCEAFPSFPQLINGREALRSEIKNPTLGNYISKRLQFVKENVSTETQRDQGQDLPLHRLARKCSHKLPTRTSHESI
ncbi:hypothetical protein WA026_006118 [Henosepilachna vigintioctopunctata]|uniref:Uncharacterized protein n=1 Tax=Henosepilachna vigintioctopunctata TaxID=420089 RepID=A0AAW1TNW0_9CUCU